MNRNGTNAGERDLRFVPGIPVPVGADARTAGEDAAEAAPCAGGTPYIVQRGDTLSGLAGRHLTTVHAILQANPNLKVNTRLSVGMQLCMPPPIACSGTRYVLKSGDTLYALARSNGISLEALLAANPDIDPKFYRVGDTLCIPGVPGADKETCLTRTTYTVRAGDTLTSIALQSNMAYNALRAANPCVDFNALKAGDVIVIYPMVQHGCSACSKYLMGAGETLEDVAQRFAVSTDALLRANPDLPAGAFTFGAVVCIPAAE